MSKTKIVAVLTFVGAVNMVLIDALNGGGFDWQSHAKELYVALGSAQLFFLRDALKKFERKFFGQGEKEK